LARQPTPTDSTEVRLVLKGIRRDPSGSRQWPGRP
jgi:hypothetical protein